MTFKPNSMKVDAIGDRHHMILDMLLRDIYDVHKMLV